MGQKKTQPLKDDLKNKKAMSQCHKEMNYEGESIAINQRISTFRKEIYQKMEGQEVFLKMTKNIKKTQNHKCYSFIDYIKLFEK